MLAAGALVASLLAVGAGPAGAVEEKADRKAATSACVGDALGDEMYTDVSDDHAFVDAINCIAYYGITNGTGDGSTYSPNQDVTRAEMAVFLARAAGVAGVDLGDTMDEGYGDIDDVWGEAQDAINQLTAKGILPGGDNYRPDDPMTRAEMALALIGLLDAAGAVDVNDDGTIDLVAGGDDEGAADDYFADARALSPLAVDRAAAALFELGVTNGAGRAAVVDDKKTPLDTNFDPNGTVNRGQMAAFITRALAHTSARPAGVTAQAVGNKVRVSVRNADYAPVTNAWVDVFYVDTDDEDTALNADGECGRLVQPSGDGMHACEIDGGDLITNENGDTTTQDIDVPDDGVVAWAWTGDIGDEVDDDTALYKLPMSKAPGDPEAATTAFISSDLAGNVAKMGSSVTVTLQLQNDDGDNVTGGAQKADEPAKWQVIISTFSRSSTTEFLRRTVPLTSNADGKATFMLVPPPDPDPKASGDNWRVSYTVLTDPSGCTVNEARDGWVAPFPCSAPTTANSGTFPGTAPLAAVTDGKADNGNDAADSVTFTDVSAVASEIEIETSPYVVVAGRAGRTALNRATVKVTDQFGNGVRNAKVTLTSSHGQDTDDETADVSSLVRSPDNANAGADTVDTSDDAKNGREFTTGSDGTYTFGYTWSSTDGAIETLTARTSAINGPLGGVLTAANSENVKTAMVRWAQEAGPMRTEAEQVMGGNLGANEIVVVVDDVPTILYYDDDDRFNTDDGISSMAAFEKVLAAALAKGGPVTNVTWSSYSSRPRHTSSFTLTVPG